MTTVSDDFNRANEAPLSGGGNWTTIMAIGLRLNTNVVDCNAVGTGAAVWTAGVNAFALDQFSQATISSAGAADYASVVVMGDATGGGQGYVLQYFSDLAGFKLFKMAAGALGANLQTTSTAWTSGDTARAEAITNGANVDIKLYRNGTQINTTYTDSASPYTTGQPGMLYVYGNVRATKLDNWSGGDIASGGAAPSIVSLTSQRNRRTAGRR